MKVDLPAEIVFLAAILLTIGAFVTYGLIIKRLLVLIKGRGIWLFHMLGALCLAGLAVFHIYRMVLYFPRLRTAGPADLFDLIIGSLSLARIENILLFSAGVFSLIGGLLYYKSSSK
jgi:hypothetical protein